MVAFGCGGTLRPTSIPCTADDVDLTVTLRIINQESFYLNVDYGITVDGVQVDESTVVLAPGEDRTFPHTITLIGPLNTFRSILACDGEHEIGMEIISEDVIGGLAPARAHRARAALAPR